MPLAATSLDALATRKRETYRSALALAWADGVLSQQEARHLADLREVLALPPEEYAAIEREFTHATQA
ncbi:MAG: hypothetical protein ACYDCK_15245 [Thermoplasmatota archaeon]